MYKLFLTIVAAALCLGVYGCSGGFDGDGAGADELGRGIFGPDTTAE